MKLFYTLLFVTLSNAPLMVQAAAVPVPLPAASAAGGGGGVPVAAAPAKATLVVEEPYRYKGLEEEILSLLKLDTKAAASGAGGGGEELPPALRRVLPSSYFQNLREVMLFRFAEGFSVTPGIIPPHPRAYSTNNLESYFPTNYLAALLQHLFPAATEDLFVPNTLLNDPIASLNPSKIGGLIRLVDEAVATYDVMSPLPWRIKTEQYLYNIIGKRGMKRTEDIDTDEFSAFEAKRGIVEGLKFLLNAFDPDGADLDDTGYGEDVRSALRSETPYTNILKLLEKFVSSRLFETGFLEEGELENILRDKPYGKKATYALRKKRFVDILLGAIEDQALQPHLHEGTIQKALSVFFHRRVPEKTDIAKQFFIYTYS